jgi:hypothetical protein
LNLLSLGREHRNNRLALTASLNFSQIKAHIVVSKAAANFAEAAQFVVLPALGVESSPRITEWIWDIAEPTAARSSCDPIDAAVQRQLLLR